jgi:hypothetical protein
VRGEVLGPPVGLDLDDAGLAPPRRVVADQARSEQPGRDVLGRTGQPFSIDDAQAGVLA